MSSVGDRLRRATTAFPDPDTAWIDALVLLEVAADRPRAALIAELREPEAAFNKRVWERFDASAARRSSGTPVAYIVGRKEFWGLEFVVDPRVLIPRPDTETLVEAALEHVLTPSVSALHAPPAHQDPLRILDCCTGSGCVGIAVASELRERGRRYELTLSDLSRDALDVAQLNAERLLAEPPRIVQSDLLRDIGRDFDIITANPPYLSATETEVALAQGWGEPALALAALDRGLEILQRLSAEALGHLHPNGYLLVECADNQSEEVAAHMQQVGFLYTTVRRDLSGRRRVVIGGAGGTEP